MNLSNFSKQEIDALKKVAQLSKLIQEQQFQREERVVEAEELKKYYQYKIDDLFIKYEKEMSTHINEASDLMLNASQELQEYFYDENEKLVVDFNNVLEKMTPDLEGGYTVLAAEFTELQSEINKISQNNLKNVDQMEDFITNEITNKVNEMEEKHKATILAKERELESKCKSYVEKEAIDGYAIIKQYEAMIEELKEKFYKQAKNDPRQQKILQNIRDCLLVLKEGIRHAQLRLLKLQSVSGSNITKLIQRRKVLIDDYQKDLNDYDAEMKAYRNEDGEEQTMHHVDIDDLITQRQKDKEENNKTIRQMKKSYEVMKSANEIEIKQYEEIVKQNIQNMEDLKALEEQFQVEENDMKTASERSRETKNLNIALLERQIEEAKENNSKKLNELKKAKYIDKEKNSIEIEATNLQNESEIEETKAKNQYIIDNKAQYLPEFRERVKKYKELSSEKQTLSYELEQLKIISEDNDQPIDENTFKKRYSEREQKFQKERDDYKSRCEQEISNLEHNFNIDYEELEQNLKKQEDDEIQAIKDEYELWRSEKEKDYVTEFESLTKQLDQISIPIIDETEQKAQLKMLQVKKRDLSETVLNQKNVLFTEFKSVETKEEERHQQVLLEIIQDSMRQEGIIREEDEIRQENQSICEPLEQLKTQLSNDFASLKREHKSIGDFRIEDEEGIQELRKELSRLKGECSNMIVKAQNDTLKQKEKDKEEFNEKKKEIENVTINQEESFKQRIAKNGEEIEKLTDTLQKTKEMHTRDIDFHHRQLNIQMELLTNKFNEQYKVRSNQIDILKKAMELKSQTFQEEIRSEKEKLEEKVHEITELLTQKMNAINDKKKAFLDEYEKIITERQNKLEQIKEAYKNKPLRPTDQQKFDQLTQKKEYLERMCNFESRTLVKYASMKVEQEESFNSRFGNNLIIAERQRATTSMLKVPRNKLLPPLRQVNA